MTIGRRWENRRLRLKGFGIEPDSRRDRVQRKLDRVLTGRCGICSKPIVFEKTLVTHLIFEHGIKQLDITRSQIRGGQ